MTCNRFINQKWVDYKFHNVQEKYNYMPKQIDILITQRYAKTLSLEIRNYGISFLIYFSESLYW